MRLVDVLFSFTEIVIALACLAILGIGLTNAMIAIGIASIPFYARVTHSIVLVEKGKPYFEAGIAAGAGHIRMIFLHLLPNVIPTLIVVGTLGISTAVLAAAGLSFLGLGAQPPQPEWGFMLSSSRDLISRAPWMMIFPGMAIAITVLGFNLLGDGIREILDPRPCHTMTSLTGHSHVLKVESLSVSSVAVPAAIERYKISPTSWTPARRSRSSARAARARACPAWRCSASCRQALPRSRRDKPGSTAATCWHDVRVRDHGTPRRSHHHDLPGADDLAQPGPDHRPPAHRGLIVHKGMSMREAEARSIEMIDRVRIPNAASRLKQYPHELSGGMRQRIMIAMAMASDPAVLIADEPTTALDVTVQAQILDLMRDLKRDFGTSIILITHDMGVVAEMADRVVVMHRGHPHRVARTDLRRIVPAQDRGRRCAGGRRGDVVNRQIRRLGLGLMVCYFVLFAQLNWLQIFHAEELNDRPDNTRAITRDFNEPRGSIVTADGRLVAFSEETGEVLRFQRVYPMGELFAHVVGSYSFQYGADGVERVYNDELSGQTPELRLKGFQNPFVEDTNVGTVELTLRADVQQLAAELLDNREGSVVALDPRTGSILAMYSNPTYDPNLTSANSSLISTPFREAYLERADKPLLAKTYRERFFPGSTFKVVTAAAGLAEGVVTRDAPVFPDVTSYTPPLTTRPISNFGGSTCGGALFEILARSCNAAFAEMGAEFIGPDPMINMAEAFGFNQEVPIDLTLPATSAFPESFGERLSAGEEPGRADIYEDTPGLAQSSIGQANVAATSLQMALVAAGVANAGNVMTPHVMSQIRDRDQEVVDRHTETIWQNPVQPADAEILRQAMVGVVETGTATAMAIPGFTVGGKTGTAQLGTEPPRSHAWVIGFAGPPGGPAEVAVAVLVEGQPGASEQTGGTVAAPIAQRVMELALAPMTPPPAPETE